MTSKRDDSNECFEFFTNSLADLVRGEAREKGTQMLKFSLLAVLYVN